MYIYIYIYRDIHIIYVYMLLSACRMGTRINRLAANRKHKHFCLTLYRARCANLFQRCFRPPAFKEWSGLALS